MVLVTGYKVTVNVTKNATVNVTIYTIFKNTVTYSIVRYCTVRKRWWDKFDRNTVISDNFNKGIYGLKKYKYDFLFDFD